MTPIHHVLNRLSTYLKRSRRSQVKHCSGMTDASKVVIGGKELKLFKQGENPFDTKSNKKTETQFYVIYFHIKMLPTYPLQKSIHCKRNGSVTADKEFFKHVIIVIFILVYFFSGIITKLGVKKIVINVRQHQEFKILDTFKKDLEIKIDER